jgi:hypothetical protein
VLDKEPPGSFCCYPRQTDDLVECVRSERRLKLPSLVATEVTHEKPEHYGSGFFLAANDGAVKNPSQQLGPAKSN